MSENEMTDMGTDVPKKKRKKTGIVFGAIGAVVVAGAIAVLAIGPAKVLNSLHRMGSTASYYRWVETKNSLALMDLVLQDGKKESFHAVDVDLSLPQLPSPIAASVNVYQKDGTSYLQVPLLSKDYVAIETEDETEDDSNSIQYFLETESEKLKPFAKKYLIELLADTKPSVELTKKQSVTVDQTELTADQLTVTFDVSEFYETLAKIAEEMKIDEEFYEALSDTGMKKSVFKSLMNEWSDWAKEQAEDAAQTKSFVMECYVNAKGAIVGRKFIMKNSDETYALSYLLETAKDTNDLYLEFSKDTKNQFAVHLTIKEDTKEVPAMEDAKSFEEYLTSLVDGSGNTIVSAILGKLGIGSLLDYFDSSSDSSSTDDSYTVSNTTDLELGQYKGIELERPELEVTDAEINQELDDFVEYYSDLLEITDRTNVMDQDYVVIDYTGMVDGKEFEGGTAKDHELQIGSQTFIDGFEEQLIGMNVGDSKVITVTFPEVYENDPDLAGKKVQFDVKINQLGKRELSDEFVAANSDCDTVEEYREQIYQDLVAQKEYDAQTNLREDVMSAIIQDCTIFSLDETAIAAERKEMEDTYQSYADMYGVDLETYVTYMFGLTMDDFKSELDYFAEYYVKEAVIISKIADAEGLGLSVQEYEQRLAQAVDDYGFSSAADAEEKYGREELSTIFLQDKVYEFLLAQAIYTEAE